MKLQRIFRTAWEGLMLNKARSFLTTLGVIIGVASVIIMLAVSAGAEASIADQINSLGANLIIVSPMRGIPGASKTLLLDDALAISEQVVGITGISAEQSPAPQNVRAGGITLESIAVVGTTADFPEVRDYAVAEGRYFDAGEDDRKAKVVVLGSGIATDLFGAESAIGQTVSVDSTKFTVIGVMASKGIVADVDYDGRIYIPVSVVFQKYMTSTPLRTESVRTIYLKAESQEKIDSVISQVTALLAERHDVDIAKPDFTVQTIGIMNIMLVSVTERTREIGLRQALGARPANVLMQFLIEAVILSLAGGLVGVLGGIGGSYLFGQLGTMRTEIVPLSIPLAFGAAAAVGIFFGYYPATRAAKLDPIEALRRE